MSKPYKILVVSFLVGIYASIPFVPYLKFLHGQPDYWHYAIYAVLYLLLFPIFDCNLINTYLLTCSFGISDELIQFVTPGRFFELKDILRDAQGATMGMLIVCAILKYINSINLKKK